MAEKNNKRIGASIGEELPVEEVMKKRKLKAEEELEAVKAKKELKELENELLIVERDLNRCYGSRGPLIAKLRKIEEYKMTYGETAPLPPELQWTEEDAKKLEEINDECNIIRLKRDELLGKKKELEELAEIFEVSKEKPKTKVTIIAKPIEEMEEEAKRLEQMKAKINLMTEKGEMSVGASTLAYQPIGAEIPTKKAIKEALRIEKTIEAGRKPKKVKELKAPISPKARRRRMVKEMAKEFYEEREKKEKGLENKFLCNVFYVIDKLGKRYVIVANPTFDPKSPERIILPQFEIEEGKVTDILTGKKVALPEIKSILWDKIPNECVVNKIVEITWNDLIRIMSTDPVDFIETELYQAFGPLGLKRDVITLAGKKELMKTVKIDDSIIRIPLTDEEKIELLSPEELAKRKEEFLRKEIEEKVSEAMAKTIEAKRLVNTLPKVIDILDKSPPIVKMPLRIELNPKYAGLPPEEKIKLLTKDELETYKKYRNFWYSLTPEEKVMAVMLELKRLGFELSKSKKLTPYQYTFLFTIYSLIDGYNEGLRLSEKSALETYGSKEKILLALTRKPEKPIRVIDLSGDVIVATPMKRVAELLGVRLSTLRNAVYNYQTKLLKSTSGARKFAELNTILGKYKGEAIVRSVKTEYDKIDEEIKRKLYKELILDRYVKTVKVKDKEKAEKEKLTQLYNVLSKAVKEETPNIITKEEEKEITEELFGKRTGKLPSLVEYSPSISDKRITEAVGRLSKLYKKQVTLFNNIDKVKQKLEEIEEDKKRRKGVLPEYRKRETTILERQLKDMMKDLESTNKEINKISEYIDKRLSFMSRVPEQLEQEYKNVKHDMNLLADLIDRLDSKKRLSSLEAEEIRSAQQIYKSLDKLKELMSTYISGNLIKEGE